MEVVNETAFSLSTSLHRPRLPNDTVLQLATFDACLLGGDSVATWGDTNIYVHTTNHQDAVCLFPYQELVTMRTRAMMTGKARQEQIALRKSKEHASALASVGLRGTASAPLSGSSPTLARDDEHDATEDAYRHSWADVRNAVHTVGTLRVLVERMRDGDEITEGTAIAIRGNATASLLASVPNTVTDTIERCVGSCDAHTVEYVHE